MMGATLLSCLVLALAALGDAFFAVGPGIGPLLISTSTSTNRSKNGRSSTALAFEPWDKFQSWQKDAVREKAMKNEKWEETVQSIMKVEGWSREDAEKRAIVCISDPVEYMAQQTDMKVKKGLVKKDPRKIDGFFPMEWLTSGDFGWGYARKRKREAAEAEAAAAAKKK